MHYPDSNPDRGDESATGLQLTGSLNKPSALSVQHDGIPVALCDLSQWLCWKWEYRENKRGKGKWTKVPLDPKHGCNASSTDSSTWSSRQRALAYYESGNADGIGCAVTLNDPYVGIDLDDIRDQETGHIDPWAQDWINRFASYTEITPSGTGVRIWIRAESLLLPGGQYGRRTHVGGVGVEIYSAYRYFTVTGHRLPESPSTIEVRQAVLTEFLAEVAIAEDDEKRTHRTDMPLSPPLTDAQVRRLAANARNGEKYGQLQAGNTQDYDGDDSAADLALLGILSFYTQDPEQLDRLFRQSHLYREKWERADYRERTIKKALARDEIYQPFSTNAHSNDGTADEADRADGSSQKTNKKDRGDSQATSLVDLIIDTGAELFHDPNDLAYITIPIDDHRETHAVAGIGTLANRLYYRAHGNVPSKQALQDAIGTLTGKAVYDGPQNPVWTRLGEHASKLYLDLGDASWQAIEIDGAGWRLVPSRELPVKFRRPGGMHALPIPTRGGSLHDLDPFLNVNEANDRMLIKGWLVGLSCRTGGRAILELLGEQGTSKSTLGRMLRQLVDPRSAPLRAAPRDEEDLMIAANNGLIVAYDNLSYLSEAMSDAFCRLSTGGGIGKRQLYTDLDEVTLEAQRPILLTGITSVATRSDMLDRTISITLRPIPAKERRTESDLWATFDAVQPRIVGGLLDAVSAAIANRANVRLERMPRLADFVIWVEAARPTLGWETGEFARAIETNRSELDEIAIEAQAIGQAVLSLMDDRDKWAGTASALLTALTNHTSYETHRDRSWPKGANQCSKQLARLAPNLRRLGIEAMWDRTGKKGTRTITLSRVRAV